LLLIAISVFSLFHPRELVVTTQDPPATHVLRLGDSSLPFTTSGEWTLAVPGKIKRTFRGRLDVTARNSELLAIVQMDIETAVASVVAAEIPPGSPMEALRAQAVAARSFLTAAKDRHRGFDFCDTTHCQFLRQPANPGEAAFRAAESTRGLTLQYRGQTIAAFYSADCGGHTSAGPPGADGYAYARVECPRRGGARRGHGMGLCQEGATALALSGEDYLAILGRYYPGAVVGNGTNQKSKIKDQKSKMETLLALKDLLRRNFAMNSLGRQFGGCSPFLIFAV
jgi:hypothetical protein